MPVEEKKYFVDMRIYLAKLTLGRRNTVADKYDFRADKTGPLGVRDRGRPINFDTCKGGLNQTPSYFEFTWGRDTIKERIAETDEKTVYRTSTVIGRLLYPRTRLPGEKGDRRTSDRKAYHDKVTIPLLIVFR